MASGWRARHAGTSCFERGVSTRIATDPGMRSISAASPRPWRAGSPSRSAIVGSHLFDEMTTTSGCSRRSLVTTRVRQTSHSVYSRLRFGDQIGRSTKTQLNFVNGTSRQWFRVARRSKAGNQLIGMRVADECDRDGAVRIAIRAIGRLAAGEAQRAPIGEQPILVLPGPGQGWSETRRDRPCEPRFRARCRAGRRCRSGGRRPGVGHGRCWSRLARGRGGNLRPTRPIVRRTSRPVEVVLGVETLCDTAVGHGNGRPVAHAGVTERGRRHGDAEEGRDGHRQHAPASAMGQATGAERLLDEPPRQCGDQRGEPDQGQAQRKQVGR